MRLLLEGDSQIGDPGFPHGGGDGLDRGADGVEQGGQLAGALRLPALLQDEPREGHHVGVEGRLVGHAVGGAVAHLTAGGKKTWRRRRPEL